MRKALMESENSKPFKQAIEPGGIRDTAIKLAKIVMRCAKEAWAKTPEEELDFMRKRMMAWIKAMEQYAVDIREIDQDEKLTRSEKSHLRTAMNLEMTKLRVKLFGAKRYEERKLEGSTDSSRDNVSDVGLQPGGSASGVHKRDGGQGVQSVSASEDVGQHPLPIDEGS